VVMSVIKREIIYMFREITVGNLGLLSGLKASDELETSSYFFTVTQIVL
jgi:hypothetical protein